MADLEDLLFAGRNAFIAPRSADLEDLLFAGRNAFIAPRSADLEDLLFAGFYIKFKRNSFPWNFSALKYRNVF